MIDDKKRITLSKHKERVQKLVNAYIRKRDSRDGWFTCISCGKTLLVDKMNAGHYVPVGKSQGLRFDDSNIHGQCAGCNCFDKFHLVPYRKNLIAKIGIDKVEWLEAHAHDLKKWTRDELEQLEQYYTQLLAN